MDKLDHTFINLEIHVCGVVREVEAEVKYIHTRAFRGIFEKGGGQITPDEPENAEIQTVRIPCAGTVVGSAKPSMHEIMHLLTDEQIEAISTEVLEAR